MLRATVWLVPAICVAGSIGLAIALIVLDADLHPSGGALLFPGPPAGARSFLSAIVQAMISFTAVVFSITMVVLQLSSSQFSPRVLRHFMRDLVIQFSLGVFIATFTYALVVLRAVRGGSGSGEADFVPRFAVTGAFVLVMASVMLFIAYIAHVVNMIRVAAIIASIGKETHAVLSRRDLGGHARRDDPAVPLRGTVAAHTCGVLVSVNTRRLVSLAAEHDCVLRLCVRIGDYLPEGAELFEIHSSRQPPADEAEEQPAWQADLRRHVAFEIERTTEQDAAFGFRQLVDIALQALSPAVNAPTTAAQAIDEMHGLLRRLVTTPRAGEWYRDDDGELRLMVPRYDVADYLQVAIAEIWRYGSDAPQVPDRLRKMLDDLYSAALPEHRPAVRAWRDRARERAA